jgi:hypothetical protein
MDPVLPNLYQFHGTQLHLTYTTTSVDGKPRFTYQDAHRALSFSGDEIRTTATEIGTVVTVTLLRTVDVGFTTFSLLLPTVHLDQTMQASIATKGITTVHRTLQIPVANRDQLELYTVTSLTGTARMVEF